MITKKKMKKKMKKMEIIMTINRKGQKYETAVR